MIARLKERAGELVDLARALPAVPHLIERSTALELRLVEVEQDRDTMKYELGQLGAIARELYVGPPADAEVPDA